MHDVAEGKMRSAANQPAPSGSNVGVRGIEHLTGEVCRGGDGSRNGISEYRDGARSLKGVTKMWTSIDVWNKQNSRMRSRMGRPGIIPGIVALLAMMASTGSVRAQCGAGGDFSGNCVRLEWRPAVQTAYVGQTVEVGLYAVSVNAFGQPVQGIGAVIDWDETLLELLGNKGCSGGTNDGQACVTVADCPGGACVDACADDGTGTPCFTCPEDVGAGTPEGYNWVSSGFPNDSSLDGLNADCGPGTFCPSYTSKPFNDGTAFYQAIKQVFCGGGIAPAPEATQDGLEVTRIRFQATAPGVAQVGMLDNGAPCATKQKICLGGDPSTNGLPCNVESDCLGNRICETQGGAVCQSDADCPPGINCPVFCKACNPDQCCTADEACTSCSFAETRVVGGIDFGIIVTAPPAANNPAIINISNCFPPEAEAAGPRYIRVTPQSGPPTVAIGVRGVGPNTSCIDGYLTPTGTVSSGPWYQTPATWGTILGRDLEIVASGDYEVYADCDESNPGFSESDVIPIRTWDWADADNSGVVDVLDFVRAIDGFRGDLLAPTVCSSDADCTGEAPNHRCNTSAGRCIRIEPSNVDLVSATGCQPDVVVDILDIVKHVDEFRGVPEPCLGPCVP